MQYCPACGAAAADDAHFCEACGHDLAATPDSASPTPAAPSAPAPVSADPTPPAAEPLAQPVEPPAPQSRPTRDGRRPHLFVWLAVAALVLAGAGVTIALLLRDNGDTGHVGGRTADRPALFPVEVNGKYGFIDRSGRMVIKPQFSGTYDPTVLWQWPSGPFADGLRPVEIDDKWGFIDTGGAMVIKPRYDDAALFTNGLAFVRIEDKTDVKCGFIDTTGRMVIGPARDVSWKSLCSDGRVCWSRSDNHIAIYDRTGTLRGRVQAEGDPGMASYGDGLLPLELGTDEWGYVDKSGRTVIPPRFEAAGNFSEGLAPVLLGDEGWGYIDTSGDVVIEGGFEDAWLFVDGLATVGFDNVDRGFIDTSGATVFRLECESLYPFSDGLALVTVGDNDEKAGFVDKSGEMIIEPQYTAAAPFCDGLAPVEFATGGWGYIDTAGELVWQTDSDWPSEW
jgi:hypothetical protein